MSTVRHALFGLLGGAIAAGGVALASVALLHVNRWLFGAICGIALVAGGVAALARTATPARAGWIGAGVGLVAAFGVLAWAVARI